MTEIRRPKGQDAAPASGGATPPDWMARALRAVATRVPRLKGLNWLLRRLHPPGGRGRRPFVTQVRAIRSGPSFQVDSTHYLEWFLYFYGTQSEPIQRWIERHVTGESVCLDVGMNFGFVTCLCAHRGASVHGFEPVSWLTERARFNCALNGFERVTINQMVLADQAGELCFYPPPRHGENGGLGSLVRVQGDEPVLVPAMTLDGYVRERGLARVDFIKIDVEGAEAMVLAGGRQTLRDLRPWVLFERNAGSFQKCRELLDALDYQLFDLRGRPFAEAMLSQPACNDFVALPGAEGPRARMAAAPTQAGAAAAGNSE